LRGGVYKGYAKEMGKGGFLGCCIVLFLACCFVMSTHSVEATTEIELRSTDLETMKADRRKHSSAWTGTWSRVSQKLDKLDYGL
jgi:hypothetical protein